MVVQHNLASMNANRMLGITTGQQAKSSEKLSSGYQINRAADDAAGLSISEKMRKQIKGLDRASTNAEDGISAVQTAEGALAEVHSMLQRMNELAVQAANGTNSAEDRNAIQAEVEELTTEINRVAESTKFNETYLLKGSNSTKTVHINAKDAGLNGTLVQGATDTSTFTMELNVGEKVSIGGADYRLYKTGENDIETVQAKIWDAENGIKDEAKEGVVLDGSTYRYVTDLRGNGTNVPGFVDSNGNAYTGDQLAALVGDGSTVTIKGETTHVVDKDADDAKTINQAITLVENALTDASSIGGTVPATVSVQDEAETPDFTEIEAAIQGVMDDVIDGLNTTTLGQVEQTFTIGTKEFTVQAQVVDDGGNKVDPDSIKWLDAEGNEVDVKVAVTKDLKIGDTIEIGGETFEVSAAGGEIVTPPANNPTPNLEAIKNAIDTAMESSVRDFEAKPLTPNRTNVNNALVTAFGEEGWSASGTSASKTVTIKIGDGAVDTYTGTGTAVDSVYTPHSGTWTKDGNPVNDVIDTINGIKNGLNIDDTVTINGVPITVNANETEIKEELVVGNNTYTYKAAVTNNVIGTAKWYDGEGNEVDAEFIKNEATRGLGIGDSIEIGTGNFVEVQANPANAAAGGGDPVAEELKGSGTYTFDIKKATVDVQKELTFSLHVGADTDMTNKINVNIAPMDAAGLGIQGLNVADATGISATYAIDSIADAIAKVSEQRSALGPAGSAGGSG